MKIIRELNIKDTQNMLNCLNDKENMKYLTIGHKEWQQSDCEAFIEKSLSDKTNKNFAIVNDNDDWVGTISLKNIDLVNKKAEYAIITDRSVHGTGCASKATFELFDYAFHHLGLHKIFLNVISDNVRAIAFYKRSGFTFVGESHDSLLIDNHYYDLCWFEKICEEQDERY